MGSSSSSVQPPSSIGGPRLVRSGPAARCGLCDSDSAISSHRSRGVLQPRRGKRSRGTGEPEVRQDLVHHLQVGQKRQHHHRAHALRTAGGACRLATAPPRPGLRADARPGSPSASDSPRGRRVRAARDAGCGSRAARPAAGRGAWHWARRGRSSAPGWRRAEGSAAPVGARALHARKDPKGPRTSAPTGSKASTSMPPGLGQGLRNR
jgi:hypothetical protein